jgi:hypothetical protein
MTEMETPIARVRGLGSAREGGAHWWQERQSAVAAFLLYLWLIVSLVRLAPLDQRTMTEWLRDPFALRRRRGRRRRLGAARGARLRRAGLKTACITKVFPTRSHTVAAQGGISAARQHGRGRLALAHVRHRQGVGLARRPGRDRISGAANAPAAVYELEHGGVPFSRTEKGKIYQRAFGGMTQNYGEGRRRSAPAPPPTAPATPCCTRCTAVAEATTPSSSSNISPST